MVSGLVIERIRQKRRKNEREREKERERAPTTLMMANDAKATPSSAHARGR